MFGNYVYLIFVQDFSVVALYRRMVIGFAFMLPNASNTGDIIATCGRK